MTEAQEELLKKACWNAIKTFNSSGIKMPTDDMMSFVHRDAIEMIRLILLEINDYKLQNQSLPLQENP